MLNCEHTGWGTNIEPGGAGGDATKITIFVWSRQSKIRHPAGFFSTIFAQNSKSSGKKIEKSEHFQFRERCKAGVRLYGTLASGALATLRRGARGVLIYVVDCRLDFLFFELRIGDATSGAELA